MASINLTTVVNAALNLLGILDSGGGATAQELTDALPLINNLILNKSYDRMLASFVTIASFSTVSGTQGYAESVGPEVVSAVIKIPNGLTEPLKVVNASEWGMIPDRDRRSYLVKNLFYSRAASGNNIFLSPIPLGGTVEYVTWTPMTTFADTTTPIAVEDAYARWLEFVAALELSSAYPSAQVTQGFLQNVAEATATLRSQNASLFGEAPPTGQVAANAQPPQVIKPIPAEGG